MKASALSPSIVARILPRAAFVRPVAVWLLAAAALAGTARLATADNGGISPAELTKVKQATVYLRVRLADGRTAEGSGFFAEEPGVVLTNAHVLGMLASNSRRPARVEVVLHGGEAASKTLPAEILGVDPFNDLAAVRVAGNNLPQPLPIGNARDLNETQTVYIFGFPFGQQLGKNLTVSQSSVSSLRRDDRGALVKVQVNGGMHPGNSGGPVVDTRGSVVGVAVSGIRASQIHFAIPAEQVRAFLTGRATGVTAEQSYLQGGQVKIPLLVELIDPLGRVRKVAVESWIGAPGPLRPGGLKEPAPLSTDSARHSTVLTYDKKQGTATGDLLMPPLAGPQQVYWFRGVYTDGSGVTTWRPAFSSRVFPVERQAALLRFQPFTGAKKLDLVSKASLKLRDPAGETHTLALNLDAGLLLRKIVTKDGADTGRVRMNYSTIKMALIVDGKVVKGNDKLRAAIKELFVVSADLKADAQGVYTATKLNLTKASRPSQVLLGDISDQVLQSLELLSVPLPGVEVEPLRRWQGERRVLIGPLGLAVPALADVRYQYLGQRVNKGRTEAVIGITGALRNVTAKGPDVTGRGSGAASVDVATGQIVSATITLQVDLDLVFEGQSAKANGTLTVQLKRAAAKSGT